MAASARVHVRASFTSPTPVPLFIVAVEVLEGQILPGMFVRIPLNRSFDFAVQILSVAPVRNDLGVKLLGLVLDCENDEANRELIDMMGVGDEVWEVSFDGPNIV
jgi:hypothetical protein